MATNNYDEISRLLEERRIDYNVKQGEVGDELGVDQSTISGYEKRPEKMKKKGVYFVLEFLRAYGFSGDESIRIARLLFADEFGALLPKAERPNVDTPPSFQIDVPLRIGVSDKLYSYSVPKNSYRPSAVAFRVPDDGMSIGTPDSLHSGDYVLADTEITEIKDGHLYVLEKSNKSFVIKRARRLNNVWHFLSDNPTYGALRSAEVNVIGEVYQAFGEKNLRVLS